MAWSVFFAVLAFAAGYWLGLRVGITGITREDEEDDLRGIL